MTNEFAKVMSENSDEQLIKILTVDKHKYNPIAIEAANVEVIKRNINPKEFENIRQKTILIKEEESNTVGSGIRFINFLIDIIAWAGILYIIGLILNPFIPTTSQETTSFIGYTVSLITFIAYYTVMEIKFQKTLGKFVTKTKVIKMNGEIPNASDIFTRSLCRLIPFDRLSFLFYRNGIHDNLSRTKVVHDTMK